MAEINAMEAGANGTGDDIVSDVLKNGNIYEHKSTLHAMSFGFQDMLAYMGMRSEIIWPNLDYPDVDVLDFRNIMKLFY